ncbi:MAG: Gfo/Idh/MocA family oxidoreductase [Myxococcota bacterium]
MSVKLRVAVVGLGVGFGHIAAYRELADQFEIVAVCDPVDSKREIAHRFLDVPHGTGSFDELLERDDLDIINICTPPNLHVEMVRRVLESGRHAICEKPLAGSVADVDALAECERASSGRLMPIFQYRFGRGVERFRRVLAAGLAGKPYVASVETLWTRGADYYAAEWRGRFDTEMGGVCVSHAIHSHELLVSLLGPVRRVFARTATRVNPIETEDCAAVTLEFESGALATLIASLGSARELSRLRLCFENLSVESGLSPYKPGCEPWIFEPANPDIAAKIDAVLAGFEPGPELYTGQFLRFHDALVRDEDPPVTVADARASIELASAIYYSSRTGDAVELPLGPRHPYYRGWIE